MKLLTSINTSNIHAFDAQGHMKKFESPYAVIKEFYQMRLDMYAKRKSLLIKQYKYKEYINAHKINFIEDILNNKISLKGNKDTVTNRVQSKSMAEMGEELVNLGYKSESELMELATQYSKFDSKKNKNDFERDDAVVQDNEEDIGHKFDYLLKLPISSFTHEKMEQLEENSRSVLAKLHEVESISPKEMWLQELKAFKKAYNAIL